MTIKPVGQLQGQNTGEQPRLGTPEKLRRELRDNFFLYLFQGGPGKEYVGREGWCRAVDPHQKQITLQTQQEGKCQQAAFSSNKKSSQNSKGFISVMAPFLPLLTEQVSTPEIKVLNWTQENGNCSLMLACMVERGDHVTYNWSEKTGTNLLSPANSSHLLYLTLGPQHANNIYICTASNPISNRSGIFSPGSRCKLHSSGECPGGDQCATLMIWAQSPPGPVALLPQL